jgi:hypothetical protein
MTCKQSNCAAPQPHCGTICRASSCADPGVTTMTVVIAEGFGWGAGGFGEAGGLGRGAGGVGWPVNGRGGAAGEVTGRGLGDNFGEAATAPIVGFGPGELVGFGWLADVAPTVADVELGAALGDTVGSANGVP